MTVTFRHTNRFGPLTEERLVKLEKKLKARVPDDYRAFLLEHNGGQPLRCEFRFVPAEEDDEIEGTVEWLFAIHDQKYRDPDEVDTTSSEPPPYFAEPLERVRKEVRDKDLIPIGRDPCANLICLGITGERAGAVWFADHETEMYTRLADSFTAFLAMLTPLPPGNWVPWLPVGGEA